MKSVTPLWDISPGSYHNLNILFREKFLKDESAVGACYKRKTLRQVTYGTSCGRVIVQWYQQLHRRMSLAVSDLQVGICNILLFKICIRRPTRGV